MNKFAKATGLVAMALMAGCSSSGSDGGGETGGTVVFPLSPGANGGAISASTLGDFSRSMDKLTTAIENEDDGVGPIDEEQATGKAELKGYIGMDVGDDEVVVGNLTVKADFDYSSVEVKATDFAEFRTFDDGDTDPEKIDNIGITGGELSGSGDIIGNEYMTSSLDGTIETDDGAVTVDAEMDGQFIDNGGTLTVLGDIEGTTSLDGASSVVALDAPTDYDSTTDSIENGKFIAMEQ